MDARHEMGCNVTGLPSGDVSWGVGAGMGVRDWALGARTGYLDLAPAPRDGAFGSLKKKKRIPWSGSWGNR